MLKFWLMNSVFWESNWLFFFFFFPLLWQKPASVRPVLLMLLMLTICPSKSEHWWRNIKAIVICCSMAQPVRMIFTTLPKSSLTFRSLPLLSAGINPSSAQFAGFFWGEEVVSSVLCFFRTDTCLFRLYFCISRVTLYVCINWWGGASAQFLACVFVLRVIFLKKIYQWSYIYFKKLIVKLFFVLVIFEGITVIVIKSAHCGTFFCCVSVRWWGWMGGAETFHRCYLISLFYFPDYRWMIEWLSPGCCLHSVFLFFLFFCKSHENTAHSHVTKKQTIFHVRDVLECKTWIPPTTLFLWFILESVLMN